MPMNRLHKTVVIAIAFLLCGTSAFAASTKITIYNAVEKDQLGPLKQAIEANVPDVQVDLVADSTGVIAARLLAERERPQADMVITSIGTVIVLDRNGQLEPYKAKGFEKLQPSFRDESENPSWVGLWAYLGALCVNTVELNHAGLPLPQHWSDLTGPAYRNQVVMPNPASSGTGYMMVTYWLQSLGEEKGWKYMDALHENIASYTHSGSTPSTMAAQGEYRAGVASDMIMVGLKTKGAPIDIILPEEGTGWDMLAAAVIRGRPPEQTNAAERVMDWLASARANELFSKYFAVVAMQGVGTPPPNYPENAAKRMYPYNLSSMVDNRDRILAEWSRRYEGKSAKR